MFDQIRSDPRTHAKTRVRHLGPYILVERVPSVDEYVYLRSAAGLTAKDAIAASAGLPRSLYGVCVEYEGEAIGMGRVVGDGGVFFDIVDIAVIPRHRKKGLGKAIMDALMEYIWSTARPTAWINLMAGPGVEDFYKRYGFITRGPERPGMSFMIGSGGQKRAAAG